MSPAFAAPPLRAGDETELRPLPGTTVWLTAIATPAMPFRDAARRQCREALRRMLAARLACSPAAIELLGTPGQAPRVGGQPTIGVSISHEQGLSLVAANFAGPVGIDLLKVDAVPRAADEITALCRDYLGPDMAARLDGLPAEERSQAFARAWTQHEAGLKCLGRGLEEWCEEIAGALSLTTAWTLDLPSGYVGALALRRSG